MVKASRLLHMGQPALSQAIAQLEETLGLKLFDRTTRSLCLTQAGEAFYKGAAGIVDQHQRLARDVQLWASAQQGEVTIMSIPSIAQWLLPGAVAAFQAEYPEVKVVVHDLPDPQLVQQIEKGTGDLALQTTGYQKADSRGLRILRDPMRWLAHAGHPHGSKRRISPGDLAGQRLILLRKGSVFRDMVQPLLHENNLQSTLLEVDQLSTLLSMVASGIGVSLVPATCCPGPDDRRFVHLPLRRQDVVRTLLITRPSGRSLMPTTLSFIKFLLSHIEHRHANLPTGSEWIKPSQAELRAFFHE